MTDKPYTEDDIETAAEAIAREWGYDSLAEVDALPPEGDGVPEGVQARASAQAVLAALAAAGRLLPEPIETRIEWGVWWYGPIGDGIRLTQDRFSSREAAEEHAPTRIGDYGITRYRIHRREHRIYADHSSWSGTWEPDGEAQP